MSLIDGGRDDGGSRDKQTVAGQQETLCQRRYYYAYADSRFSEVADEPNGYRKGARLAIFNNADRWVRLI